VDMGMMLKALSPGMEHAEEADLGTEVAGITSNFKQRRGTGAEEQIVSSRLFCRMSAENSWGRVKTMWK